MISLVGYIILYKYIYIYYLLYINKLILSLDVNSSDFATLIKVCVDH
jgi:hypothetical protein